MALYYNYMKINTGVVLVFRFAAAVKNQFYGYHPYRNFINPLNPNQKCKRISLDKCKLMNSKMRPHLLTFENAATFNSICGIGDISAPLDKSSLSNWMEIETQNVINNIRIMYKKGDDLRQDRLTLQLLAVIDRVWKEAGKKFYSFFLSTEKADINPTISLG